MAEHDEFNCECHETCSWCTTSVLWESMEDGPNGENLCWTCFLETEAG